MALANKDFQNGFATGLVSQGRIVVTGSDTYTKQEINDMMDTKVDKVTGKDLSTNDYTDTDKVIVDSVTNNLNSKVDKVDGKGLSTNDFTNADKTKLDNAITEHQDISGKYDKAGGEITGNVKIDGNLVLDIEDDTYDSGIKFEQSLDLNQGTILKLQGYANSVEEPTNYKVLLRNIATPASNFDAANKKYVDDKVNITWITGYDNEDGTVLLGSTAYTDSYNAVTTNKMCFIKLTGTDGVHIMRLKDWVDYNDHSKGTDHFVFTEDTDERYKRQIKLYIDRNEYAIIDYDTKFEHNSNKVSTWNATVTDTNYPTEKLTKDTIDALRAYVDDQYGAHIVYETDGTTGVQGLNNDGATTWQLEDLDLTPYKRIKIYTKASTDTLSGKEKRINPQLVCEMSLDDRGTDSNLRSGSYMTSVAGTNPEDRNVWFIEQFEVDSTKTKFRVLQQISLYNSTVGGRNSDGRYVYKIEGYKN